MLPGFTHVDQEDYISQSLSVTFSPDELEKPIRVPIIDDPLLERSETFYGQLMISFSSAHIARITTARASIEISYNDCNYFSIGVPWISSIILLIYCAHCYVDFDIEFYLVPVHVCS